MSGNRVRCDRFASEVAELRAALMAADGIGGCGTRLSKARVNAIIGGYSTAWWLVEFGWPLVQPELVQAFERMTGVGVDVQP